MKEISQRYNSDDFQAILSGSPSEEIPSVEPISNESREESSNVGENTIDSQFKNIENDGDCEEDKYKRLWFTADANLK